MEFSEEQKIAINKKDANILVRAAAGSGKTRVLVEKIIRLVCGIEEVDGKMKDVEPVSIDDILVMTFTNNATTEMKNRIKEELFNKIKEKEKNNKDTSYLEYQLSIINGAHIQTIDSFCKEMIDQNFSRIEKLDPKYRMADEKELELLKYDILIDILEEKYNDEKYVDFLKLYFYKSDDLIRNMLNKGLFYISSKAFPMQYLDDLKDNFDKNNKKALDDYKNYVLDDIKNKLNMYIKKINISYKELDKLTLKTDNAKNREILIHNIESFGEYVNKINKLYTNVEDKNLLYNITNYLEVLGHAKIIGSKGEVDFKGGNQSIGVTLSSDDNSNFIFKKFKKSLTELLFTQKSYFYNIKNEIINLSNIKDEQVSNKNELLYIDLLKEYYEKYEEEKIEKKVIAISDLQKLVLELLYTKQGDKYAYSDFASEISKKYKYIFIDEYQDTNIIQEKIVEALSNGYKNRNVFMVGDVKQSIYRFRNADVSIFNNKCETYKDKNNVVLDLNSNYRSSENIVKFVNAVFEDVMTKEATKIDYKKDNMLVHGREEKEKYYELDTSIDYYLLNNQGEGNIKDEAFLVSNIIKKLHNEDHIPYKDITILLRKEKNTILHFMKTLQNNNIPVACTLKEGFYDSYEIQLIVDILSTVDNPYDDICLTSVLTSCVIDLTNNELAFLKNEYNKYIDIKKSNYFSMEDAIKIYIKQYEGGIYDNTKNNNFDINVDKIYSKIKKYADTFNYFRNISRYKSINDLIYIICDKTNLFHLVNNMPLGKMREENIKLLIDKAKNYENTSYVGLNNFIRYIEHIKEQEIDEGLAQAFDDNDDLVHITTIHKSKGLQYNVVIMPNLSSKYIERSYVENDKRDNAICFSDEYGVSLNYVDYDKRLEYVTPKRCLIDNLEMIESKAEEMRILYVALTRAKEKLILVDNVRSDNKRDEFFDDAILEDELSKEKILSCNSFSKLMNHTINRLLKEESEILNVIDVNYEDLQKDIENQKNDDNIEEIDILSNENLDIENENKYSFDILKKNESFVDKYKYLTNINPKISVSNIKSEAKVKTDNKNDVKVEGIKEEIEITDNDSYDIKDNEENENDIKGTDVGNLYHRFMEIYDFSSDVEKFIDSMIEKEYIDKEAKNVLDINKINMLLESDFGKKLKEAHDNKNLYREQRFMKYFKRSEIENYKSLKNVDKIEIKEDEDVDIIVQGIIDAFYIMEENSEKFIDLIDYKTDGIKYNKVSEKNLIDNYKVQLDIYKKALEDTIGLKVRDKILYSFTLNKAIKV